MPVTELEKMQRAKMYIDKLANGINPLDDTPIAQNDLVSNARISRCLTYVSDILRQVIENEGRIGKTGSPKNPFPFSDDMAARFAYSDIPIPISEITKRINDLIDTEQYKKVSYNSITAWLVENGALAVLEAADGKTSKTPTAKGTELGITTVKRMGLNGEYTSVLYNRNAQRLILENLQAMLPKAEEKTGYGRPWTAEQDEQIRRMYQQGIPVRMIAEQMMRTPGGIESRLNRMGLTVPAPDTGR